MILSQLVEQQIQLAIKQKVNQLTDDPAWLKQLEQQTVDIIQQRIVGKFSNIETVPDLVNTVELSVEKLFANGRILDLSELVDEPTLKSAIDLAIQDLVKNTIDNLVVDPAWLGKVESIVNLDMSAKLTRMVSQVDLNKLMLEYIDKNVNEHIDRHLDRHVNKHIDSSINRWQSRLKENFSTRGIQDQATAIQLTVMDGAVVAEHDLVAKQVLIDTNAVVGGTLTVNNLVLKGRVNTDNPSWKELSDVITNQVLDSVTESWTGTMVESVLERTRDSGIDFDSITINGESLVSGNQLNNAITETNIQKTGTLRDLTAVGTTQLSNTVNIRNRRVGINTEDPEMALGVWDEEVSIVVGKLSEKKAFIGTARSQDLSLGVNRKPAITINTDGLTTINQLRIDRFRLSYASEVPGYSGTRGDFVFNSDPKPDSTFAWVCLGGFKWQPLRSA